MKRMVKHAAMFAGFVMLVLGCVVTGGAATRGDQAFKNSNYTLAITEYSEALRLQPHNVVILRNRGIAHFRIGDFDRAISDFETAQQIVSNRISRGTRFAGDELVYNNLRNELPEARRQQQLVLAQAPHTPVPSQPRQVQVSSPALTPNREADFRVEMNREGTALIIREYTSRATVVHIPATIQGFPVTEIGNWQHYAHGGRGVFPGSGVVSRPITSVVIPEGVRYIREYAFAGHFIRYGHGQIGMTALTSVTLPSTIRSIGYQAFSISSLTTVNIPDSVTNIEFPNQNAFAGSRNLDFPTQARLRQLGYTGRF